ncbi:MAG: flagellar hook protein FlgE [Clostridiales bacterium]|nr:flagellar hook protein FlgE [Clostridiales bacterium]
MLRSMFSGVSGLTAHQLKMDVIGNNIANVNTTAFKSSSISFQDLFSQTIKAPTQPTLEGRGGTNPQQVGLGVHVGGISVLHEGGSIQSTGNPNDLAVDGDGFFVVTDGSAQYYTRAGNFQIDGSGNLATSNGSLVLGWNLASGETLDVTKPLEPINLANISMPARATSELNIAGNIDSAMEVYDSVNDENYALCDVTIYDSLGAAHVLTFKFMKTAANEFEYEVLENDAAMSITSGSTGGAFTFDGSGKLGSATPVGLNLSFSNGAQAISLAPADIRFDSEKFIQFANTNSVSIVNDGYSSGSLSDYGIDGNGTLMGVFSNGMQRAIGALAIAVFPNTSGLEKIGNNEYTTSWNSGGADIGLAGTGGRGTIATYSLEMSNVDLANEFTEMIIAQRGFQANSRIITTADEMLQELVNLKR